MAFHLETERLVLRPFAAQDAEIFARYRSDPVVAQYQGWNPPVSLEQAKQFITAMQILRPTAPGKWNQIAIERKDTQQIIGDVAFQILAEDHQQAEIGFTLAREHHGKGYALESVAKLLEYLFSAQHLHRVRANADPENTASCRLMERLGMRQEGRFIQSLWFKGRWADEAWYAILDCEWQALQLGKSHSHR